MTHLLIIQLTSTVMFITIKIILLAVHKYFLLWVFIFYHLIGQTFIVGEIYGHETKKKREQETDSGMEWNSSWIGCTQIHKWPKNECNRGLEQRFCKFVFRQSIRYFASKYQNLVQQKHEFLQLITYTVLWKALIVIPHNQNSETIIQRILDLSSNK